MTPDEFLARARPLELDDASREAIDDLKRHIEAGGKLDPLHLYPDGKEDGRHRAYAAKELGIEQVPVTVDPFGTGARRDLLGDDTGAAQALADETAARDAARNAGQVDLETGDPSDLFSVARNQANLFDQPTAVRAIERAQDLITEDPERMITLLDETGAERKVPISQAFADLDAEEAALRRVAMCATPGEA